MFIEKQNDIVKTFLFDVENEQILLFVVCGRDIYYEKILPGKMEEFKNLDF